MKGAFVKNDILEAQYLTLVYYINNHMSKRFAGRSYNPDYPKYSPKYAKLKKQRYPGKPTLVATGRLKRAVLKSKAMRGSTKTWISLNLTEYGRYLLSGNNSSNKKWNFVPPKTKEERMKLQRYFKKQLARIRKRRK